MSAWVVSKEHIDVLVQAALPDEASYGSGVRFTSQTGETVEVQASNASVIGRMLWQENVRSVAHRYSDDDLPGAPIDRPRERIAGYTFTRPATTYDAVTILKQIDCYAYQSCEHDEWPESNAARFCDSLRKRWAARVPGYEAAPWGV